MTPAAKPARMSAEEIERGLVAQGVPREKARVIALAAPIHGNPLATPPQGIIDARAIIALPLRFTVPWSALVSDNDKYGAVYTKTNRPKLILTAKYREAKRKVRDVVIPIMGDAPALNGPLELRARVWVPDKRPGHDVANFAKCCHDALEHIVYPSDEWLHRVVWERAGVDVDRPRAEITINDFIGYGL